MARAENVDRPLAAIPKWLFAARISVVNVGAVFRPSPVRHTGSGREEHIESGRNVFFFAKDVGGIAEVRLNDGAFRQNHVASKGHAQRAVVLQEQELSFRGFVSLNSDDAQHDD